MAAALAPAARCEVVKIQLPLETAVFKPAPGVDLANGQCLTCHSADYIATQPPKGRDFWKAEVEKMKSKYGAPIPPEVMSTLIGYFARNYGTETASEAAAHLDTHPGGGANGTIDVPALARQTGCLACHNVAVKVVGPAYKDVAAKYRGRADAMDKVRRQITRGGSGQWGEVMMPPFQQLSAAEVDALARWVLSQ